MDQSKLTDDSYVTRKQLRQMGLDYTSTQYGRWEKVGLTAHKAGGRRSARVYYRFGDVKAFFGPRMN